MKKYYIDTIIGDGLTPETAYRPSIADVVDPITGFKAFQHSQIISTNPDGTPALPWCLVIAAGPNHKIVEDIPEIDALPLTADLASIKISALDTPSKLEMASKLQARDIDTSFISNADGMSSIVDALGKLHDPSFSYKNFDTSE